MNTLRFAIRLARLPLLLIAALLYFLGVGVARYLGVSIDWGMYLLGQAWVTLVQFVIHALNEYFESPNEHRYPGKTLLWGSSGVLESAKLPRPFALWASAACALSAGLITVLIIQQTPDLAGSLFILFMILGIGFCFSIPPLRLSMTGYGELALCMILTVLVPVLAFLLQDGGMHRLLTMVIFPLSLFFLSLLLIVEFPDYAIDIKIGKNNALLRLGWQRGMTLHNLLISGGIILFAIAVYFGFPIRIAVPLLMILPVGLSQILMINRIRQGGKPNWSLLLLIGSATFGLSAYFLAYGFWTH